ncbi:glycosyltransferase [Neolewinella lacunae]|uniref:Glycosyltransferase n=1 Tax=Neolewinella lacunae TaxID=1517758 RepID=A0A923PMS1_9BACT|nr:glycosyltransferase [Neolewinella lacunae]MBC6994159.1 glycosyltransferase [Neolewinella lacunae]MDN3636692.1 glycosyltransferase [Neolewinella lacunae]
MRIINLVDSLAKINFGVWNAAIATVEKLYRTHGVKSVLVGPNDDSFTCPEIVGLENYHPSDFSLNGVLKIIKDLNMNPAEDIVVSHGCWRYPTRWGKRLKEKGFVWIAVPHGMLEPYCLQKRWLIKKIYFGLLERPALSFSDLIRAVSQPEMDRLKEIIPRVDVRRIPNCVEVNDKKIVSNKYRVPVTLLYLGRLHFQKNPVKLVEAWKESKLYCNPSYRLVLAGPDQGELAKIENLFPQSDWGNIAYVGPVYGEEKSALMESAAFFALPSENEGLPTSVLEAMQYGCVSLLSKGCNLPDAIKTGVAFSLSTDVDIMTKELELFLQTSEETLLDMGRDAVEFVNTTYSTEVVAAEQYISYERLLKQSL